MAVETPFSAVKTMRAIQKPTADSGFKVAELPVPEIEPHEVLIQVKFASICGTDFHITNWDDWSASRITPPLVYGHEFCGHIVQVGGDVEKLKAGDYVSAEMHWFCGDCRMCKDEKEHICENGFIYGIDRDGCYAQFIKVDAQQVVVLPDTVPPEYGAFLDALGNAVHAASKVDIKDQVVHVVGCGPIGLFCIAVANALGAKAVYASDIAPFRIDLANQLGATKVFNPKDVTVSEAILEATGKMGADVVLEMSGNAHAINDAFVSLRQGGSMVMLGIPKGNIELDINKHIIFKEATVIGCNGRKIFETWDLMLELLSQKKLDLDPIITHRFPLDQFGEAMKLIEAGVSGKILLEP